MTDWWRPVALLARTADRIPAVGAGMRRGYRGTAEVAARIFASIREVDGVYLTGSLTRPEHVRPGISDIDLVVAVNVPTLESELALQKKLRLAHAALNGAVPLFSNLDYLEAGDLALLRRFGNAWCLDSDCRFRPIAGESRLVSANLYRPAPERSLMQLARCVKRWMKGSSSLFLSKRADPVGAERVLRDVLAGYTDTERLSTLEELLARAHLDDLPALDAVRRGAGSGELYLAASLEVLERWIAERTQHWQGTFPVRGALAPPTASPVAREASRRLLAAGFASTAVLSRGGQLGGSLLVAVAPPEPALASIERAQGVPRARLEDRAEFGWAWYPILLTPALYRAAALLAPEPLVGAAASSGGAWSEGASLEPPLCPARDDLDALVRARVVRLMLRRFVRSRRPPDVWQREQLFDAQCQRPVLAPYEREGVFDFQGDTAIPAPDLGPEKRLEAQRAWTAERRGELFAIAAR